MSFLNKKKCLLSFKIQNFVQVNNRSFVMNRKTSLFVLYLIVFLCFTLNLVHCSYFISDVTQEEVPEFESENIAKLTGTNNVLQRKCSLFNNSRFSDLEFIVNSVQTTEHAEEGNKVISIPVHGLILSLGSSLFESVLSKHSKPIRKLTFYETQVEILEIVLK